MALGANLTIMVHPSAYVVHRPHNLTTIRNMWCSAINSRNTPEKAQAAAQLAGESEVFMWEDHCEGVDIVLGFLLVIAQLHCISPFCLWANGCPRSSYSCTLYSACSAMQRTHPSQMPRAAPYHGGTGASWCTGKERNSLPQRSKR
jgi:hypothetical protein